MDDTPINEHIVIDGRYVSIQIRPCCDDNVVDYAIWMDNKLEFTMTKKTDTLKWIVAMKNSDDMIDDITVKQIGMILDKLQQS